jgi:hypothetical protein
MLPNSADNIAGMIAGLWNDLGYRSGETGQYCYFYDTNTNRFIVEWYQIHDWSTGTFSETFQIQLLNPTAYPTPTGDAEWLLLYQEVSTQSLGSTGATIGMESNAQTNGFTYLFNSSYTQGAAPVGQGVAIKITTIEPTILDADIRTVPIPQTLELAQNYPNPFNPETTIEFAIPKNSFVKLAVFNVLGQKIATLVNRDLTAGVYHEQWHGTADSGVTASSGIYFYRLETAQGVISRKMILMR